MFRIFCIIPVFFIFFRGSLVAQADVKIKKSEFKAGKTGFKQAWDHVVAGDDFYKRKGTYYNNALDHYTQALVYNSLNPELNYKTGISAIYTDHKEEASGFFLKAHELKNDVTDDILLYTGRALQYNGRYYEAIDKLTVYLNSKVKKAESNILHAKRFIEECNSALILTKDTLRIEIRNIGANINSDADDFSPVLSYDGSNIYFASGRKNKIRTNSSVETSIDENIYFSAHPDGAWGMATLAGDNLTTKYNEAPLYIDSAGTRLYIYSGSNDGGDIKVSVYKKDEWKAPESLPLSINSIGSETSLAFHPSGNELYFVTTEGKDNLGGHDVYFIVKKSDKKWSKPQNAGSGINTAYDEQSVSFSNSGDTIWFSSRGHNSIGGFDIFYSVRNPDGTWGEAVNGGYPLNTPWDELFHSTASSSDSIFYFASNRNGGFGGLDIYIGRILSDSTLTVTSAETEILQPQSESPEEKDDPDDRDLNFIRED